MVGKVAQKIGEMVRMRVMLYKSVLQSVLPYESESWVVTGAMLKVLEVFHHRVARIITGMALQRMTGREW